MGRFRRMEPSKSRFVCVPFFAEGEVPFCPAAIGVYHNESLESGEHSQRGMWDLW